MIALLLAAAPAAQPATSARAFVEAIYARWEGEQRRGHTDYTPPSDGRVLTPELAALIAKDARISRRTGEVGEIDAVPLCGCQDDEGLHATVTGVRGDARAATVRLRLTFGGGEGVPIGLRLVRLPAGWRIADIASPDDPSLLRRLHRALDRQRG